MKSALPGQCIYEDLSLPFRSLRDQMHAGVDKVRIDDRRTWERAVKFANEFFSPTGPTGSSIIRAMVRCLTCTASRTR